MITIPNPKKFLKKKEQMNDKKNGSFTMILNFNGILPLFCLIMVAVCMLLGPIFF